MPFADAAALAVFEGAGAEVAGGVVAGGVAEGVGAGVAGGVVGDSLGGTLLATGAEDTLAGMTAAEFTQGVMAGAPVDAIGSVAPAATETLGAGPAAATVDAPATAIQSAAQTNLAPAATDAAASQPMSLTPAAADPAAAAPAAAAPAGAAPAADAATTSGMSTVNPDYVGDIPVDPAAGAAPESGGIINSALDFAKQNPLAATLLATQISGAVGGVGKAALEKEIQQRNIQARKDLLSQQTEEQQRLSRAGTLKNPVNIAAKGNVLRRPDGTPVFTPTGIINRAIGQ